MITFHYLHRHDADILLLLPYLDIPTMQRNPNYLGGHLAHTRKVKGSKQLTVFYRLITCLNTLINIFTSLLQPNTSLQTYRQIKQLNNFSNTTLVSLGFFSFQPTSQLYNCLTMSAMFPVSL